MILNLLLSLTLVLLPHTSNTTKQGGFSALSSVDWEQLNVQNIIFMLLQIKSRAFIDLDQLKTAE